MDVLMDIIGYVLVAVGGGATVSVAVVKFWGKTFVEKRVNESLKIKQHELDTELDKLKASNARINHISLSLYDEELKALKELVVSVRAVSSSISTIALSIIGEISGDPRIISTLNEEYNELMRHIAICSIFVDEELYNEIEGFRTIAQELVIAVQNRKIERNISTEVHSVDLSEFSAEKLATLHEKTFEIVKKVRNELLRKKHEYFEI